MSYAPKDIQPHVKAIITEHTKALEDIAAERALVALRDRWLIDQRAAYERKYEQITAQCAFVSISLLIVGVIVGALISFVFIHPQGLR